ncbi:MAG: DNA-directed RNA polymerase subunit omega [Flavobacteriales bacterium]|uniref:DNA-directed RNA polymerase subunit omega n=1 Tax=Sanyastnella coralliicola TaxID=3069118 RepID=UPI0027BAFB00|nr:DNA-directed RNA polymerase subunit omega [Longitalea sp. SCSIO 12813]MCH2198672.1 DNA-directed RNA polymerase subunit omega [Flavobacteriales bacterium]
MSSIKNSKAERTTVTRNTNAIDAKVEGNLFEALVVISKRANQIQKDIKEELTAKLEEFATTQDNLEEVFENREQIEISKFYERLPKPHSVAIDELLEDKVYFRRPELGA